MNLAWEEAYREGRMPPGAREAWERLAWALDVDPEGLPEALARLDLPRRAWILVLARVGWRATPPGAEVLAGEGLLDLEGGRLTRKGAVVLEAVNALLRYFPVAGAPTAVARR